MKDKTYFSPDYQFNLYLHLSVLWPEPPNQNIVIVRISACGGSKDPPILFFLFEVQSSDTCVSITIVLKDASKFIYKNALHELQTVKHAINMKCVHWLINLGQVI